MEKESENEMIEYYRNQNISVDVLDVAHHGSSSSSLENFLDILRPSIAVISVGADNTYNHPTIQTLQRLEAIGARILRTDQEGDIVIISDGQNLSVN
jgi:beta-lactamase superfamily II metal-dependent hydrolase